MSTVIGTSSFNRQEITAAEDKETGKAPRHLYDLLQHNTFFYPQSVVKLFLGIVVVLDWIIYR